LDSPRSNIFPEKRRGSENAQPTEVIRLVEEEGTLGRGTLGRRICTAAGDMKRVITETGGSIKTFSADCGATQKTPGHALRMTTLPS